MGSWVEHLGKPGVQQRVHWRVWTKQVPIWLTIAGRIDMSYHVGVMQASARLVRLRQQKEQGRSCCSEHQG